MAARLIFDRLDDLLQGKVVDAVRKLDPSLEKLHDAAERPESWYPAADPTVHLGYLLLSDGATRYPSHEVGQSIRQLNISLALVAYDGGEAAVTAKRQELERILADTWEQVISLLSWPANFDRGTTGWWATTDFHAGSAIANDDRLVLPIGFTAIYAYNHGA